MTSTTKWDNNLQFESFVVFQNFLKALLQHCSSELSQLRTATELKSLATHPEISQYATVLMDDNFVLRWYKLYADCFTGQKFQPKSMLEEANMIINALSNRCDLLTKFNDFPAPPSNDKVDMKRYDAELSALIVRNKNVYNGIQKWFIDRCILTTRVNIAMLNLQYNFKNDKNGDCYKLEWRSLASSLKCCNSPNYKTTNADVADYMKLAVPGNCKCESQADNQKKTKYGESRDRPTAADSSVSRTAKVEKHPKVWPRAPEVDKTINIFRDFDFKPIVNTDVELIENLLSQALPPTPKPKRTVSFATRPVSDPTPKRVRRTPAREIHDPTKLGKYATFKQFLEVLRHEFSTELSKFKNPCDIQVFLADRPGMEPFQDILENLNFVTQWALLHEKCEHIPNAENTMKTAAREIELGLENKGSLIKHFADYPTKPQDNDVEDMGRFVEELKVMRNLGQSLYNINQKNYLKGIQSTFKRKREFLLQKNSQNLPDVIRSRSSTTERTTPRAEAVTVPQRSRAASAAPARGSSDGGSAKKSAIDYFIKENPNVPEEDVFREFSYLEPEKRNRYVKMAEEASGNVN